VTASRIADCARRAVESGREEAVASGVDRLAAEARELAPDRSVVLGEQRRPLPARLHGLRRRVDEIGEEHRCEHAPPLDRASLPRFDDELGDLAERHPVEPSDLHDPAVADLRRHVPGDLGRGRVGLVVEVGRAVDDQRRHLNRRQRAAHVDVHVHPAQREQRGRAERQTRRARPPDGSAGF
jgi:hypothetical protein